MPSHYGPNSAIVPGPRRTGRDWTGLALKIAASARIDLSRIVRGWYGICFESQAAIRISRCQAAKERHAIDDFGAEAKRLAVRFHLNLQWKILLLVAGMMTTILFVSSYSYSVVTRSLVEQDRYQNAVALTLALEGRIATYDYFTSLEDLRQEIQVVMGSSSDIQQIDVYQNTPDGPQLIATSAPQMPRLAALDEHMLEDERRDLQHPFPGVVSFETERDGARYWLIAAAITNRSHSGSILALVRKSSSNNLVSSLQRQYLFVVGGAVVASVVLLYLLFVYFFRLPARDIVRAMAEARAGATGARVVVRREDELGEIGQGFNRLMDDLSERSREREELLTQIRGFNEELRGRVETATVELRAAGEALFLTQERLARSERLAAVGQVAASLAHEIGTPLNAISGHLQLLARNYPHDADTQRRLQIINKQLAFIVQTVKSLLERTHRPQLALQPTDLNALVRELLRLVGPMLDSRAISASARLDETLPPVLADRDGLYQVFLNLVNNSIDAMPNGGQLEIVTHADRAAGVAEVVFRDSGTGIATAAIDHLFEPTWTTKESGSGLGLAIAREIMIEHGGQIECISGPHEGAAFRLTLPLAGEPSETFFNVEVKEDDRQDSAHPDCG